MVPENLPVNASSGSRVRENRQQSSVGGGIVIKRTNDKESI